jgi:hypothetical protein
MNRTARGREEKKRIIEVFKLLIGTSTGCGWKIEEDKKKQY